MSTINGLASDGCRVATQSRSDGMVLKQLCRVAPPPSFQDFRSSTERAAGSMAASAADEDRQSMDITLHTIAFLMILDDMKYLHMYLLAFLIHTQTNPGVLGLIQRVTL